VGNWGLWPEGPINIVHIIQEVQHNPVVEIMVAFDLNQPSDGVVEDPAIQDQNLFARENINENGLVFEEVIVASSDSEGLDHD
jgi:hypothetical protein